MNKKLFVLAGLSILLTGCVISLPAAKKIDVPFSSQAPAGDWSEPWQNACEETSIYMISSFYAGDAIKQQEAIKRIHEIFVSKAEDLKVSKDESLQTIAELISSLGLPWKARIVPDPTVDDLKTELTQNNPIIVPVYAPELSPNYLASEGVEYHVVVLTGYDDADGVFIINDPGTSQGENVRVPYDVFMNAIHDLDANDYLAGNKAVLFTERLSGTDWLE